MKLAFISDIHGNATALDAVLEDVKKREIDKIFVLGDLCFRGLEPKRSLDLIKSLNTDVIKGNAEEWIVRGVREGEVADEMLEVMNKERDWTYSNLDRDSLEYLHSLPGELNLDYDGVKIHAFHATPTSLFEAVQPTAGNEDLKNKLMQKDADIYIYAHIHQAFIRYLDGKCLINTGSVGMPFDGVKQASYAVLDIQENSVQPSIVKVDYGTDNVIRQFEESDYPNKEFMINVLQNASL